MTISVDNGTITPLSTSVRAANGQPDIHGPITAIKVVMTAHAAIHVNPNIRTVKKPAAFRRLMQLECPIPSLLCSRT